MAFFWPSHDAYVNLISWQVAAQQLLSAISQQNVQTLDKNTMTFLSKSSTIGATGAKFS